MFNNISWEGYWTALAITVSLYYLIIVLTYYRSELLIWVRNRNMGQETGPSSLQASSASAPHHLHTPEPASTHSNAPDTDPAATSLIDEVQAFFESASQAEYTKETLLLALRKIFQKHPGVSGGAYQYSVNNLVVFLAEQSCSLYLSGNDIDGVWSK